MLHRAKPATQAGKVLQKELDLAVRMAAQSCKIMLWQQALAAGRMSQALRLASRGIRELRALDRDFNTYWSTRNKATAEKCSAFLSWRMDDYRRARLHFPPKLAKPPKQ